MDVEKVGPSGSTSPSEKKGRKSTPDSEEFSEMMKTDKVGETEFEGSKKKRYQPQEETPQLPTPVEKSKPNQPTPFYSQPRINAPDGDEEPSAAASGKDSQTKQTDKDNKIEDTDKKTEAKDKKHVDKKKKENFDEVVVSKKEEMKIEPPIKKVVSKKEETLPGKKISVTHTPKPLKKDQLPQKALKKSPKEEIQLNKMPPPKKEEPYFSQKNLDKDKEERKKTKVSHEISAVLQEMPPSIANQVQTLTSPLTPYLHPDIIPLFEKMVGTIIQIQSQGITRTQVLLNSPAFASSIFFGCSILLEKYSTAPDSFNIFLKGSQQAVIMFNENLEGLSDAFKKGNFNFKVGRLEAQHETLFRRKERAANKDTDAGTTK